MLGWFAETTLLAAVLAILVGLAGPCWPRLGPAARHALWLVVLIKLITPPLVRWPWPVELPAVALAPQALAARPMTGAQSPSIETELLVPEHAPDEFESAGLAEYEAGETFDGTDFANASEIAMSRDAPVSRDEGEALQAAVAEFPEPPGLLAAWDRGRVEIAGGILLGIWVVGALIVAARQAGRIGRFARRLRSAGPAPDWLADDLVAIAARMGVRAPQAAVVPGAGTPMLWCLGRPRLVLPGTLLETLPRDRWAGVLVHELAHLRRGDPWVGRLLLVAEWFWWWSPLYWLVRSRLEAEAELACDAWVVASSRVGRRSYAEALIDVCAQAARTIPAPVPALGVGIDGAGRFLERRLTMILRGRGLHQTPMGVKLAAALLALMAVPSWSIAQGARREAGQGRPRAERPVPPVPPLPPEIDDEDELDVVDVDVDQDDAERPRPELRERAERLRRQAEERARVAERRAREIQQRVEARVRDTEKRLESRVREAAEALQAAERKARELGEDATDEAREEAKEGVREAREGLQEAVRSLQSEIQDLVREAQREAQGGMRQAQEEMRRAREEMARELGRRRDAPSRPEDEVEAAEPPAPPERPEGAAPPPPPRGPLARPVGPRGVRARVAPPRAPVDVEVERGSGSERLERRIDALEQKFDSVLEELRALRRELSDRRGE
jgi:bla regulator protein BlaR1